jgi:hypothetical protein
MGTSVLPILLEEPPEFEFKGGLAYVIDRQEGTVVGIRAFRAHQFFAAFRKAAEACQEWRVEQSGTVERIDQWRDVLDGHAASS